MLVRAMVRRGPMLVALAMAVTAAVLMPMVTGLLGAVKRRQGTRLMMHLTLAQCAENRLRRGGGNSQ